MDYYHRDQPIDTPCEVVLTSTADDGSYSLGLAVKLSLELSKFIWNHMFYPVNLKALANLIVNYGTVLATRWRVHLSVHYNLDFLIS